MLLDESKKELFEYLYDRMYELYHWVNLNQEDRKEWQIRHAKMSQVLHVFEDVCEDLDYYSEVVKKTEKRYKNDR